MVHKGCCFGVCISSHETPDNRRTRQKENMWWSTIYTAIFPTFQKGMVYRCISSNDIYTSIVFLTSFPIPLQDSWWKRLQISPCSSMIKNTFPSDYKERHEELYDRPSVNVKSASENGILLWLLKHLYLKP